MILVLTNASDATADFMCDRLTREDIDFFRLNTESVVKEASFRLDGTGLNLHYGSRAYTPEDISCIWLRRPRPIAIDTANPYEAKHTASEWAEALGGFLSCVPMPRWINHPSANSAASYKLEQLRRASNLGLRTPETLVTQSPDEAMSFFSKHRGSVIVKPISGGYIERETPTNDTQIYTSRVSKRDMDNAHLIRRCPTLFQEKINKSTDARVTVIDDSITPLLMYREDPDGHQITDIRRDNMSDVTYRQTAMPELDRFLLIKLLRSYNLRYAAVDYAVNQQGEWIFLEINPGGQWAWLDQANQSDIAGNLLCAMAR